MYQLQNASTGAIYGTYATRKELDAAYIDNFLNGGPELVETATPKIVSESFYFETRNKENAARWIITIYGGCNTLISINREGIRKDFRVQPNTNYCWKPCKTFIKSVSPEYILKSVQREAAQFTYNVMPLCAVDYIQYIYDNVQPVNMHYARIAPVDGLHDTNNH